MTDDDFFEDVLLSPMQPIGYWSGVAHRSVVGLVSGALARQGLTQPQWWVLGQLGRPGGTGLPRERLPGLLAARLYAVGAQPHALAEAVGGLLERGWVREDPRGRLRLTEAGEAARERARDLVVGVRARLHEGVDDAAYTAALRVLRRMARNAGAPPDALR
ncbi:MarR family winged helix-turn-helix transcriptional regulator [Streptomyces sp. NPDC007369]|uniref:MarR family winged helix-turn-helix transcriptional regulator n=1 Tax=Streptomyces sp. NPDC007369 TaxID=3154589 RepID=UPI0033FD9E35